MALPNGMRNPIRRKNGRPVFTAPTMGTVKGRTQTRVPKGTHIEPDVTTTRNGKWSLVAKVNPSEAQQADGVKPLPKQRPARHKWARGDRFGWVETSQGIKAAPSARESWRARPTAQSVPVRRRIDAD